MLFFIEQNNTAVVTMNVWSEHHGNYFLINTFLVLSLAIYCSAVLLNFVTPRVACG